MSHGRYTNLIFFKNLFKPRQLYLQSQNSVLSNLWLAT
ncbi:DNA alkylation repair protein [Streptococcus pneumoniae]|nr:DNA alkylation repair protein [Streptococcus pneumoniae]